MFIKSIDTHKFKHSTHTHTQILKKKISQFNWKLPKLKTSNNKKSNNNNNNNTNNESNQQNYAYVYNV